MKIGDILYTSWGYEQTNIDFYEVIKATAKTVTVNQIKSEKTYTGDMTGTAKPIVGAFVCYKKPLRRKICNNSLHDFISITDYATASAYNGVPKTFSEYD